MKDARAPREGVLPAPVQVGIQVPFEPHSPDPAFVYLSESEAGRAGRPAVSHFRTRPKPTANRGPGRGARPVTFLFVRPEGRTERAGRPSAQALSRIGCAHRVSPVPTAPVLAGTRLPSPRAAWPGHGCRPPGWPHSASLLGVGSPCEHEAAVRAAGSGSGKPDSRRRVGGWGDRYVHPNTTATNHSSS